jgi:hypothetical protein
MATDEGELAGEMAMMAGEFAEPRCGHKSASDGHVCARSAGHAGQHAANRVEGAVGLVFWGHPEREGAGAAIGVLRDHEGGPPPASTAGAKFHYGVIKMGRRQFATRFRPWYDDVEFWEAGEWRPYSIAEFQRREIEAGTLGPLRDGPVPAVPTGLLARLGRRIERRHLRSRLISVSRELTKIAAFERHNAEVCGRLGPAGAILEQRALGKADGFRIADDLVSRVIEELR